MVDQLSLFPPPDSEHRGQSFPVGPAAASQDLQELARALPRNLYLGTSSWFFPGWRGLVWDRAADETTLARNGLPAYASHPLFNTVCIDRAFYAPLDRSQYREFASQVPEGFRFVVKAPSACTLGWVRGQGGKAHANATFLDAALALAQFVEPCLVGLGAKAGVLLFQFSPLGRVHLRDPERLIERVYRFFSALPQGPLYAIELRDASLLTRQFFAALREARAHYCIAVHPRLPAVAVQAAAMAGIGLRPLIVRWNLNPRYAYEAAKARFTPFDRLVEEDASTRESIARLVASPLAAGEQAFVIANNKAEGSAPLTVAKLAAAIRLTLQIDR